MRKLLTLILLLSLAAAAVAQSDSVDVRYDGVATEVTADASMTTVSDLSFPTELAVNDFENLTLNCENRLVASILAIVLGDFGVHHFYTGDIHHGILHAVFFWTGIPAVIGIIEGIMWLVDSVTFPDSLF